MVGITRSKVISVFVAPKYGGFLKWGVPPNHPFLDGIFLNKNQPAFGDPYLLETPKDGYWS